MATSKFLLTQLSRFVAPNFKGYFKEAQIRAISVDSRTIQPNDLFFALPGQKVDGHHFIKEVESKGACGAVVSNAFYRQHHEQFSMPLFPVENGLLSLQLFAKDFLQKLPAKVIAITGSLGKTTTKHLLNLLLKQKFRVACSPGTQNTQISLPLVILNEVKGDEELIILEMGMTEPGHIRQLTQIAPPDIALLTTIEWVHATSIDSLEDIARSKSEIFSHPKTQLGFLPSQVSFQDLFLQTGTCAKHFYSTHIPNTDYFLQKLEKGIYIYDQHSISPLLPSLPLLGKHNLHNFLAAVSVCRNLGLEWELIQQTIPSLNLPERRLEQVMKKGILFINDSYNAALVSVKAALDSLPPSLHNTGKKVAVLGELTELGINSEAIYREIGTFSLSKVDRLILYGENCHLIEEIWKNEKRPVSLLTTMEKVVEELQSCVLPGDVVLLKGSNTKKLWEILKYF